MTLEYLLSTSNKPETLRSGPFLDIEDREDRAMNYEIEENWEIWPDETLKFNSENPENATLGKPSKYI